MNRDVLCQLIRLQHNISKLNDHEFIEFCAELIHVLSRKEIESILFNGLNAMRMRGCRAALRAKDIIQRSSDIVSEIEIFSKYLMQQQPHTAMIAVNPTPNLFANLPTFLCKYLCNFLDIQTLLRVQLLNRYFCVISRQHRNYALLFYVVPLNELTPFNGSISQLHFEQLSLNNDNSNNNNNVNPQNEASNLADGDGQYLHSVNQQALNSGYFHKFFSVIKKLGSGSYGSVFLVKHLMHGIYLGKFAMKIVCVGDDLNRLLDILREVRTLQSLHHRNVIDYKHSWLENYQQAINGPLIPCLFILMEFADMGSVADYVIMQNPRTGEIKRKWLSEHEIWTIMFETCMGLKHLHQSGIVHRDIKPENLLMTSLHKRTKIEYGDLELYDTNYRIVISDLGQADFVNHHESVPETGNTGSFGFASPELVLKGNFMRQPMDPIDEMEDKRDDDDEEMKNNYDAWDESVDIWSIGQLLYFLTFSKMPYEQCLNDEDLPDIHDFYRDIVNGVNKLQFPANNGDRSDVIIKMIKKLCQIDPKQRPSLDSIIMAIANILRSHQYISISYRNVDPNRNRFPALVAPSRYSINNGNGNNIHHRNDVSPYPVIKYVPQYQALQALLPPQFPL